MATLTRWELIQINRALAQVGARICSACGRRLPLDTGHFYCAHRRYRGAVVAQWDGRCIDCERRLKSEESRRKRRTDRTWAARRDAVSRAWQQAHPARRRVTVARYRRNRFKRKLAAAMQGVG